MVTRARHGSQRLPPRDRRFRDYSIATGVGPLAMPSVAAVRGVLRELATLDPEHRLLCRLDTSRGLLMPVGAAGLERHLDRVVVELDDHPAGTGDPRADPGPFIARLAAICDEGLGDLPFRLEVGQRFAILALSHATGDGTIRQLLISVLLRCALDGSPAHELALAETRFPLLRALGRTFVADPARARALLSERAGSASTRVVPQPTADAHHLARPGSAARYDRAAPHNYSVRAALLPRVALAWARSARTAGVGGVAIRAGELGCVVDHSAVDLMERLRTWRAEHAPAASARSVLFAALIDAFYESGLPQPEDGVYVAFNARRYLPAGAAVFGNFSAGIELTGQASRTPEAIAAEMHRMADRGRPLAAMSAIVLKSLARTAAPESTALIPQPKITFSALGNLDSWSALPWLAPPEQRWFGALVPPTDPDAVTFNMAELEGVQHIALSFDAARYDTGAMAKYLAMACADPLAFLSD